MHCHLFMVHSVALGHKTSTLGSLCQRFCALFIYVCYSSINYRTDNYDTRSHNNS